MAKILFLAHRAPFPPDKGDKIRAFHILEHLAARHDVWLGAGADDLADLQHLAAAKLRCRDAYIAPLGRARRIWNMSLGALAGRPLSVARFRHPLLDRWIAEVLQDVRPDVVFVYSSAMAQYVVGRLPPGARLIVDFVDADAEKWRAYARRAPAPLCWVYAAEARRLVRFERRVLAAATAGILISEAERSLFAAQAPQGAAKLQTIANGVDLDYFHPADAPPCGANIVFCGRMDYAANVDGAEWFARHVLPAVRVARPDARFQIVGAAPSAQVRALARLPGVEVTGTVPDVRPYLANASVVVAPLRVARGIQNKVLEGMAAARPVVVTPEALQGIAAEPGREVLLACDAAAFASAVGDVLLGRSPADLGTRGRAFVLRRHQWAGQLAALDRLIGDASAPPSAQAAA
jgi:sugar transferase (PEP-CTERM/EpsH1 system associated)